MLTNNTAAYNRSHSHLNSIQSVVVRTRPMAFILSKDPYQLFRD